LATKYFCDICDKEILPERGWKMYLNSKMGWSELNTHTELDNVCDKCKKNLIKGFNNVIEILKNQADLRQIYEMKCK
jgi:hypothetical protein